MAEPLSKLAEKCKSCPKSEKCDHKRMELCALADLPPQNLASATQGILIDAAMPVLREEIKSPLSPFRYKDELEKVLCIDKKTFRKIDNVKHIGDDDGKPIETSEFHDMTIGIDVSVDAVNEYAKSILGRYPKNNYEFSRALAMKILEETKSLANNEKKE